MGRSVPSRVSRQWVSPWRRPSLPWVPVSPVPHPSSVLRRRYDFRPRVPVAYVFASRLHVLLRVRVRQSAPGAAGGLPSSLGPLFSRRPVSGVLSPWARAGSLRFPGDPSCTSALFQDPGRIARPRLAGLTDAAPVPTLAEGFSVHMISRLTHGFDTRCLRFKSSVAATHARLASGWRAPPLPGGRRTLWVAKKGFRLHPSSFPGLTLTQVGPTRAGSSSSWPTSRPMPGAARRGGDLADRARSGQAHRRPVRHRARHQWSERRRASAGAAGAERAPRRGAGSVAARATLPPVELIRGRRTDRLHAAPLGALRPIHRRRPHLSDQQRGRTRAARICPGAESRGCSPAPSAAPTAPPSWPR